MLLREQPPLHLTYGLNVHPGESWSALLAAIEGPAAEIKARVAPDRPFGLGLRLAAEAARTADAGRVADLRRRLAARGLYARTVNAFPYGRFHKERVKESVYAPDWRSVERRDYTIRVAEIFSELLPAGETACISTVPVSYRAWMRDAGDRAPAGRRLLETAAALARLADRSGRVILLALEPEPDCRLETVEEAGEYLEALRDRNEAARRHLAVCLDTCHGAVLGEDPVRALERLRAAGIPVGKIQLSSALTARNDAQGRRALAAFAEPVYFHQTCAFDAEGRRIARWPDLDAALRNLPALDAAREIRTHFHVPLHWPGSGALGATAPGLPPAFWRAAAAATRDIEIETYTFDVLPADLRRDGLAASIAAEYAWARGKMG